MYYIAGQFEPLFCACDLFLDLTKNSNYCEKELLKKFLVNTLKKIDFNPLSCTGLAIIRYRLLVFVAVSFQKILIVCSDSRVSFPFSIIKPFHNCGCNSGSAACHTIILIPSLAGKFGWLCKSSVFFTLILVGIADSVKIAGLPPLFAQNGL